jgi:hypothetical protein
MHRAVRSGADQRPLPTADGPLLALGLSRMALLQVAPQSVERANTIGSGENVALLPNLPAPWNSVQLT